MYMQNHTEMGEKIELEFYFHGTIKHQVEGPQLGENTLVPGLSKELL